MDDAQVHIPTLFIEECLPPSQDSLLNPTCTQGGMEAGSCWASGTFLLESSLSCHHSISRTLPFQALYGTAFQTVYVLVYNLASRDPSPWEFYRYSNS